ncbi:MAG: response regulator transcription factor [Anaerolineae bacterium]|nr:response regulator transcription factor [Anaerolineae bacterium]
MNGIKVLIAEDNAAYRQSFSRMLQQEEGIEVLEPARDGREAVEKSEYLRPDVVLMDIDMPERGGLWATRTIRERWPRVKVIILSFHSGEAFRAWAREVGTIAFLSKDADPEEIIRAIRMAGDATTHLLPVK